MNKTQIFPIIIMTLYFFASTFYFYAGDWKRGLYWLFAIGLNAVITF
jgi:hypothetical protein